MIFRPKRKKKMLATSPLKIDNTITEDVEQIKYLGVYQHLAWKMHINFILYTNFNNRNAI